MGNVTQHHLSLAKGVSEFCLVGSIHAVEPINHSLGHYLGIVLFLIYVVFAMAHLRHCAKSARRGEGQ
jgi:hypothetical protein